MYSESHLLPPCASHPDFGPGFYLCCRRCDYRPRGSLFKNEGYAGKTLKEGAAKAGVIVTGGDSRDRTTIQMLIALIRKGPFPDENYLVVNTVTGSHSQASGSLRRVTTLSRYKRLGPSEGIRSRARLKVFSASSQARVRY